MSANGEVSQPIDNVTPIGGNGLAQDDPTATGKNVPLDNPPIKDERDSREKNGLPQEKTDTRKSDRKSKLTPKARENAVQNSIKFMKSCQKRMTKQTEIVTVLLSGSNVDLVNNEMNTLDKMYSEFADSYAQASDLLSEDDTDEPEEHHTTISNLMEAANDTYLGCKEKVCSCLMEKEKLASIAVSVHSGSSKSSSKSGSRSGSGSSKRSKSSRSGSTSSNISLRQKAKVAGLKAEAEALKKAKEAELSAELSRIDIKIKKAEAIEKVYSDHDVKTNVLNDRRQVELKLDEKRTAPKKEEEMMKTLHDNPLKDSAAMSVTDAVTTSQIQIAMMDMIKLQSAPKPDLDKFSGDPLEYLFFKANFQDVVESTVTDQRGRLTRLINYTEGDAKELIKHLIYADHSSCYTQAISLLDKEYGNPHLISCSYIKELRNWKSMKEHDTAAIKKLFRFMLKCQAYKRHGHLQELDSTDIIKTIISKVHCSIQGRWVRKTLDIRKYHDRDANFDDLVKFIERETEIMSDPAYSRDALIDSNLIKANSTSILIDPKVSFSSCPLCTLEHDIEDCEEYLQKDVDQRHKTIFREGLCFACLSIVKDDHIAKNCTKKRKCRVCNGEHPTTLHDGKNHNSNHTYSESEISMCIVPVEIWHEGKPERKVVVYALLDDCSTGTFITDDVLELLDITNVQPSSDDANNIPYIQPTSVSVTTLNGTARDPSTQVKGLVVCCLPGHTKSYPSVDINLPLTFSKAALAVDKEEIPTPSKVSKWSYLCDLKTQVPEYDPSIPIGLMIGGNCPKAIEPMEVISSVNNGPYAKRTRLG